MMEPLAAAAGEFGNFDARPILRGALKQDVFAGGGGRVNYSDSRAGQAVYTTATALPNA